jgi:hypothetical protein
MHGPTCIFWANLTPFSLKGTCPPCAPEEAELGHFRAGLANVSHFIAVANEELGASVRVAALLIDSEIFESDWWFPPSYKAAVTRKHELIYNASREMFPAAGVSSQCAASLASASLAPALLRERASSGMVSVALSLQKKRVVREGQLQLCAAQSRLLAKCSQDEVRAFCSGAGEVAAWSVEIFFYAYGAVDRSPPSWAGAPPPGADTRGRRSHYASLYAATVCTFYIDEEGARRNDSDALA